MANSQTVTPLVVRSVPRTCLRLCHDEYIFRFFFFFSLFASHLRANRGKVTVVARLFFAYRVVSDRYAYQEPVYPSRSRMRRRRVTAHRFPRPLVPVFGIRATCWVRRSVFRRSPKIHYNEIAVRSNRLERASADLLLLFFFFNKNYNLLFRRDDVVCRRIQ